MTTMPQLGIDASKPAWANGVSRLLCNAGIRKATPLMNRNELAVTSSETTTIDQRAAELVGFLSIPPC
ncbi:hypothetical protein MKUB_16150 [Mycobacterium kubicae]|uniref:Uncharacterized protein n=1 Tax=Mycobacterium kubicae TaxID=120959 RepID=A0ABQ1BK69_9MYCO|nr:hypothetical protein A5725_10825 [Mycobacterium kubicae]OBK41474.1 hypothetical protein A5657_00605 [Mycobacterium kubicae]GFG64125.1 hypothetical protein MKUB_16150 [Mycobacterium kubicae]